NGSGSRRGIEWVFGVAGCLQKQNAAINLSLRDQNFSLHHWHGDGEKRCATIVAQKIFLCFSSRRRHTRFKCDWSSDVCSSDLEIDTYWKKLTSGGGKAVACGWV